MAELYKPLYPPEGAPVMAFVCLCPPGSSQPCYEVTRTLRGMRIHLGRKHKLKEQQEFEFKSAKEN
jgi:hypothetical protein